MRVEKEEELLLYKTFDTSFMSSAVLQLEQWCPRYLQTKVNKVSGQCSRTLFSTLMCGRHSMKIFTSYRTLFEHLMSQSGKLQRDQCSTTVCVLVVTTNKKT
jgi:hypothetical protein